MVLDDVYDRLAFIRSVIRERKQRQRNNEPQIPELKPFYNRSYILGKLLGVGGTSRVFQLGNLNNICIKICCGGRFVMGEGGCSCLNVFRHDRTCRKLDEQALNSDVAVLQAIYCWASQTREFASRICREHLAEMLLDEFRELMEVSNSCNSPLKYRIFPRVLEFGVEQERTFIIMERIPGVTLRQVLSKSYLNDPHVVENLIEADFLPAILEIMDALIVLYDEVNFFHGDLKPENMIVSFSNSKLTLRCIDPVPRALDRVELPVDAVVTIAYNPKVYMEQQADGFGLALIMYELYTAEQPFMKYRRLSYDGKEDRRPLDDTLNPFRQKHEEDKFARWLFDKMVDDKEHPLRSMKAELEAFRQKGTKLNRYIPATLFEQDQ